MKKILIAIAALFAVAAPAAAQDFTGLRVEATAGLDDLSKGLRSQDVNYGAAVGIDAPLGDRLTIGVEANVANVFDREDFGVAGRLGLIASDRVLLFGTAGYENFRNLDGLRVGGGAELSLTNTLYTKAEYRYSDFQHGVGRHQGLVGLGLRF